MHASPLVAVLVHAGVEEAVATSTAGLELVGKLCEHVVDLLTVLIDAAGVEAHGLDDAFGDDVVADVLAILEETSHEDGLHVLRGKGFGVSDNRLLIQLVEGAVM